jgi:hypothetical protein
MAFIQLDRPRRLRFGFSAFDYLKTVFGAVGIEDFFKNLNKGDLTVVSNFVEACISGDNDGLDLKNFKNLLDDFVEKNGIDKLMELINETIEESALFKEMKKKESEQAKKKR